MLTLPEHETHNHCLYGLSCSQYEELLAASSRCCQTCTTPSAELRGRKLVIDHDHQVGKWAVRGLLCGGCNSQLRYGQPDPEWAYGYLADPWWLRMLAERGLEADAPEPAEYRVLDFFDRIWFRRTDGWSTGTHRCPVISWPELLKRYGPHNLRPFTGPGLPVEKSTSRMIRHGDGIPVTPLLRCPSPQPPLSERSN